MAFTASSSSQSLPLGWPSEPAPPGDHAFSVGYLSRKALPIKRNDAEPLTREDVQFDLLNYIFADTNSVFLNPYSGKQERVPFCDLYISALYNSNKCSKVLKDKMVETPAFAIELAKISLLTNVGRINTTMAFFPEMKTALRTYHPDAPRIKNCLKAALLPSEFKSVHPSTPQEIMEKIRAGQRPPTSVVNLIFVLSNHAAPLASIHFDGSLNFLDLFLPGSLSSADRARAFLWHIFHYLETPELPNPFDDNYSRANRGKAPLLHHLSESEMRRENVDTKEEIDWGQAMSGQRNIFLHKLVSTMEYEKRNKAAPQFVPVTPENVSRRNRLSRAADVPPQEEAPFMHYVPKHDPGPGPSSSRKPANREPQPLPPSPSTVVPRQEERTMLQHAWHVITTTDPLVDSDEEIPDEHIRLDYSKHSNPSPTKCYYSPAW
ncbi:hypothetical protein BD779DRAFT_1687165 [Infundibulicybe gibba]|nr:hypothetical protein BD779DRAFT_1687165 [Infundibulicybe gibba]